MTTPAPQPMDDLLNAGQSALQGLEAEKKRLLNNDGTRVYSDAEHAAREAKLLEDFNAKIAELVTQVEQRAADVTAAAANLQADPTAQLQADELQAANLRSQFVREEAASLPLPQLLTRCQEALNASDKAGLFLWSRYVEQRVSTVLEQLRAAEGLPTLADKSPARLVNASNLPVLSFRDTIAFNKLKELLPQMKDALVPAEVRRKAQTLEEIQAAAQAFKLRAQMLRAQAAGEVATFERNYTRQYREGF